VHSAVFVADNTVFTKNGGGPREPWLLMRLEDMAAAYPDPAGLTVAVLRRKGT